MIHFLHFRRNRAGGVDEARRGADETVRFADRFDGAAKNGAEFFGLGRRRLGGFFVFVFVRVLFVFRFRFRFFFFVFPGDGSVDELLLSTKIGRASCRERV